MRVVNFDTKMLDAVPFHILEGTRYLIYGGFLRDIAAGKSVYSRFGDIDILTYECATGKNYGDIIKSRLKGD